MGSRFRLGHVPRSPRTGYPACPVAHAVSYLRYMLKVASDPRQLFENECEQLQLTPQFKSLLEPLLPRTADVPSADATSAD